MTTAQDIRRARIEEHAARARDLQGRRFAAADKCLENYVFDDEWLGSPLEVEDARSGYWDPVLPDHLPGPWTRTVYVHLPDDDEYHRLTFTVVFGEGTQVQHVFAKGRLDRFVGEPSEHAAEYVKGAQWNSLVRDREQAANERLRAFDFDDANGGDGVVVQEVGSDWTLHNHAWSRQLVLLRTYHDEVVRMPVTFTVGFDERTGVQTVFAENENGEQIGRRLGNPEHYRRNFAAPASAAPAAAPGPASASAQPLFYDESFEDGKYRVIQHADGRLEALRYGEAWRDLLGDKLVGAMLGEVERLRLENDALRLAHSLATAPTLDVDQQARDALEAACRTRHPNWDNPAYFSPGAQDLRRAEVANSIAAAKPAVDGPATGSVWMTDHASGIDFHYKSGALDQMLQLAKSLTDTGRDAFVKDSKFRIVTPAPADELESDEPVVAAPRG